MKFSSTLALAAAASSASGHTIFLSLNGGKVGDGVRVPTYDGVCLSRSITYSQTQLVLTRGPKQPITDVKSNDIACNGGPNPTASTNTVITVQAGSQATLTWRHTLTSGPNDVIDASHKGPVMAYMKKVSDAKTDSGVGSGALPLFISFILFFQSLPIPVHFSLPLFQKTNINTDACTNRLVQNRPRRLRRLQMGRRPPHCKPRCPNHHNSQMHRSRRLLTSRRTHRPPLRQQRRRRTILHGVRANQCRRCICR